MEEYIKSLIKANYTNKTIINRCNKKGWEVDNLQIEEIRNTVKLELEIERTNKEEDDAINKKKKGKVIVPLFTESETYFDFAKRIGIETEYSDTKELIGTVQKLTANIFIRQAICLLRGLELQSQGQPIELDIMFKGYDIALKAISKAWGIETLIDLNAAIQALSIRGYDVMSNIIESEVLLKN
jgi:hypothetical protein